MAKHEPQYRCECGFPCYTVAQEAYHRDRACLAIRRMVGVIGARERCGRYDHAGLQVNGITLWPLSDTADRVMGYDCTCFHGKATCPVHTRAA